MMTLPTLVPLTLGRTAAQLDGLACRPGGRHHRLVWPRVLFLIGLSLLLILGLVGIHVPDLIKNEDADQVLLGAFSVSAIALAGLACYATHILCVSVWLEDFCEECGRACTQQQQLGVKEAEVLLGRFNGLETSLSKEFLILFTVNQIVVVFSIYNTITG